MSLSNEKYSIKSKIVTSTLANCWCGIMIEEIYSGTLIPRIKFRALRLAGAIPQTSHVVECITHDMSYHNELT